MCPVLRFATIAANRSGRDSDQQQNRMAVSCLASYGSGHRLSPLLLNLRAFPVTSILIQRDKKRTAA